jgi:hypothetical protein
MGSLPNLLPMPSTAKLRAKVLILRKENAMIATEYVLFLTILRLVIPFGLILLLGELIRRRDANNRLKV